MYFEPPEETCRCPKPKRTGWYYRRCRIKNPVQVCWHRDERSHEFIGRNAKNNAKLLALDLQKHGSYGFGKNAKVIPTETICGIPVYYVIELPSLEEIAHRKREADKYERESKREDWVEHSFRGTNPGVRPPKKIPKKRTNALGFSFDFPASDLDTIHEDGKPRFQDWLSRRRNATWRPTRLRRRPPNNNWKRKRKSHWKQPATSFRLLSQQD